MKKIMTVFKEHKEFHKNRPWDVNDMHFPSDVITPPHYADTIEILVCRDIKGTAFIGGNRFDLSGRKTFFIAPNVIHSMQYKKNEGVLTIVKLQLDGLTSMVNLPNILARQNIDFATFPCCISEYDQMITLANQLRDVSAETIYSLMSILSIFQLMITHSEAKDNLYPQLPMQDEALREVISWTEAHFTEKISLDEIASKIGYNKNYFCNKFKAATGETYLQYLNNLRIYHACKLLKRGNSLQEVCENCGFEDMSYFIQLFKKIVGTTPKQYILAQEKKTALK